MIGDPFTCPDCRRRFISARSDEEAAAECKRRFGVAAVDSNPNFEKVCGGCARKRETAAAKAVLQ